MNKVFIGFGLLVSLLAAAVVTKHFWRGEQMSIESVGERWGKSSFNMGKFKNGSHDLRARMTYSLLKQQKLFVGKDRAVIRQELGDFDGFYFSDMFPTYLIEIGKTKDQDTWQIVFLLDRNEKVSEIIVHKNCCER